MKQQKRKMAESARMSARKVRAERAVARAEGLRKAVGTPPLSEDSEKATESSVQEEETNSERQEDVDDEGEQESSLEGFSRQALQRLAKQHGIRANQKSVVLRRELQKIRNNSVAAVDDDGEEEQETY